MGLFSSPEKKLITAAKKGDTNEVHQLLSNNASNSKFDINSEDKDGYCALMWGASYGYTGIIELLIEYGADINVRNNGGQSPLIRATIIGSLNAVKYLIENGADVNAKECLGETAVLWAAEKGYQEIYDYLMENGGVDPRFDKKVKQRGGNCIVCLKTIGDTILGLSSDYTDKFIYKCSACGAVYCMDCMTQLKNSFERVCVKCEKGVVG